MLAHCMTSGSGQVVPTCIVQGISQPEGPEMSISGKNGTFLYDYLASSLEFISMIFGFPGKFRIDILGIQKNFEIFFSRQNFYIKTSEV